MTTTKKCEHPGCNCQSPIGKKHCSAASAEAEMSAKAPCDCKHPECHDAGLKM
jgi:hypothetical protein